MTTILFKTLNIKKKQVYTWFTRFTLNYLIPKDLCKPCKLSETPVINQSIRLLDIIFNIFGLHGGYLFNELSVRILGCVVYKVYIFLPPYTSRESLKF